MARRKSHPKKQPASQLDSHFLGLFKLNLFLQVLVIVRLIVTYMAHQVVRRQDELSAFLAPWGLVYKHSQLCYFECQSLSRASRCLVLQLFHLSATCLQKSNNIKHGKQRRRPCRVNCFERAASDFQSSHINATIPLSLSPPNFWGSSWASFVRPKCATLGTHATQYKR